MEEVLFLSAQTLAGRIRGRELSSTEVLEAHLAQIARQNPALNAIVTLDEAGARERARAADAALARGEIWGPLHGVPVTLKDSHAVRGMRTTAGFPPLADYVPAEDGAVAARLRGAGAVLLGKTNVPELLADPQCENPIFGRTNNPWDRTRTPGGSSGGACAAVAAGLSALDIGSDIGGSIRIPAHFCGVCGLKTTEHRVPRTGHIPNLPGNPPSARILAVIGPQARTVDDLTLALQLLAGPDGIDTDTVPVPLSPLPSLAPRDLRLAWAPTFPGVPVSASVRAAVEQAAWRFAQAGAQVEETLPALDFAQQDALFTRLVRAVTRVFAPPTPGETPLTYAQYLTDLAERDTFIRLWERFFGAWDALLCPAVLAPAIPHTPKGTPLTVDGESVPYWELISHCLPFNLTGQPALVVPAGLSPEGLPIGVQIVGPRWSEMRLLAIGRLLEAMLGGYRRPPGY